MLRAGESPCVAASLSLAGDWVEGVSVSVGPATVPVGLDCEVLAVSPESVSAHPAASGLAA